MQVIEQEMRAWAEMLREYSVSPWEKLPEIELYMDQVLGYMDKQLGIYNAGESKTLTSSMINNYVKEEIIPRPEHKKYGRSHLAMLMMLCAFKQILPIADAGKLLAPCADEAVLQDSYARFCEMMRAAFRDVSQAVEKTPESERLQLATELTATATACKIAAQFLVRETEERRQDEEKPREKGKNKGKKAAEA